MERARVFMNGRSQAVRLPKSCRFDPTVRNVSVRKVGQAVILEPIEPAGWDPAYLAMLAAMPPMEETIESVEFDMPDIKGIV
jgi:antitoxin VapB